MLPVTPSAFPAFLSARTPGKFLSVCVFWLYCQSLLGLPLVHLQCESRLLAEEMIVKTKKNAALLCSH